MRAKPIALVDMDNTLVDYEGQLLHDLQELANPSEAPVGVYDIWPPHIKARAHLIKQQQGWWENLPNFEFGWDVYNELHKLGFNIHILTKGPQASPNAWTEKVNWCLKHIKDPENSITITGDKSLVYGRVLVDDYPEYMDLWLKWRPRGLGIMPAHHYNEGYEHPNVIRYDGTNLRDVRRVLAFAMEREAGKDLSAQDLLKAYGKH